MAKRKAERRSSQRSMAPLYLILAGVLLVIGVLIWAALSGRAPASPDSGQGIPNPGIQRVTLAESKAALDQKTAVFLDVRDPDSFRAGHIPGAVNIPLGELGTREEELDPQAWIITYCT